jgi:hypothetical protein
VAVNSSFEASSHNPTIEETMLRAKTWADLLFGLIPPERVDEVFRRAFREKPNDFPVNAYDLKNSWLTIQAEEAEEAKRRREREITENAVANCSMKANHFVSDSGDDDGMVEMQEGFDPDSAHLMPCFTCRPRAFAEAQARRIEERAGAGVPEVIAAAVDQVLASKKPKIKLPPETAMEYLDRFYEMIRVEYDKAVGVEKDQLLAAAFTIVHAQDYVKENPENPATRLKIIESQEN